MGSQHGPTAAELKGVFGSEVAGVLLVEVEGNADGEDVGL